MADEFVSALGNLVSAVAAPFVQDSFNAKATDRSYQYGQAAQRNSPLNTVIGLRQAGLNPAAAVQTNFTAAQGPNALGVNAQMPDFMRMRELDNATAIADAQVALLDSQREHQELVNDRINDENYTLDSYVRGQLQNWSEDDSNPTRAAAARLMLDSNELYSSGTVDGIRKWNELISFNDAALTQQFENAFVRKVYELKNQGDNAQYVADMDEKELRRIGAETLHLLASASEATTASDVNQARLSEISAHVEQMLESKDSLYYNNPAKMYKLKDKVGFFGYAATQAAKGLSAGAGFAIGSKGLGTFGRAAAGRLAPTSKKGFDAIYKTGFDGKKVGKKTTPLESLSQSEINRRLMSYY